MDWDAVEACPTNGIPTCLSLIIILTFSVAKIGWATRPLPHLLIAVLRKPRTLVDKVMLRPTPTSNEEGYLIVGNCRVGSQIPPSSQAGLLTKNHPLPLYSALLMHKQQNCHYQSGFSKPTQFKDERFANHGLISVFPSYHSSWYTSSHTHGRMFASFHSLGFCGLNDRRIKLIRFFFFHSCRRSHKLSVRTTIRL